MIPHFNRIEAPNSIVIMCKSVFLTNFDFNLKNINLIIILNKFMRVIIFKIMITSFNFLKIVIM